MALKKFCARCNKIIDHGKTYCDECKGISYKDYNKHKRDKESQSFYNSKEWRLTSKTVKLLDKGLCLYCLSNNRLGYCEAVHHIEPLKESKDKALDIDNLISLCRFCHAKIEQEYRYGDKLAIQNELKDIVGAMRKV